MDKDYNEIWLQAMDTLIVQRLQNLPFDQTIVCKIIDDSKKDQGIYTVSNESTEFEAYSENTHYSIDNQVYVNIPKGDWSQKKQITGRYSTDTDKDPIVYVAPLEKVLPLTANLVPEGKSSSQLVANWPLTSQGKPGSHTQSLFTITDKSINATINDTLCIKADFKCVLDNYAMRSGSYGVEIRVTTDTDEVIVFDLDSAKDMFGNPYAFTTWMSQQQAFKFTESIGNIKSIEGFFYQKGDFKYFDGTKPVDVPVIENGIVPNIWMQNLEVYFGTDVSQVEDNTVKIVTNNDLKYQGKNNTEKTVELIWYNKGEGNKYLGFSDGVFNKENAQNTKEENSTDTTNYYWIQWQLDGQDGSLEDLEFNIETGQEEQTLTKITINCRPELSFTELQATVWLNGNKYKSNFITFTNQTDQASLVANKDITISIVNNETSKDVYPLYGEDNKIIDSAEASTIRSVRVEATWSKGILTDTFWQGAAITWTIPSKNTMLLPNFGKSVYEETQQITDIKYTEIVDENGNKKTVLSEFVYQYHLNDVYHDLYDDNIITCIIKLPNQEGLLVANKHFEFSSQGTSGTDYTLVVRPIDDRPYGFKGGQAKIKDFSASLYDLDGNEMSNIIPTLSFLGESSKDDFEKTDYNVIKATAQVTWADRKVDLETLYPVCYAADTYSADVPLKLIYDSYGTLRNMVKSGAPLKLYKSGSLVTGNSIIWEINFGNDSITDKNKKWLPSIGDSGDTLIPPPIYMDLGSKPYLIAKINGEIVWTSPIIIQQYKYGSEVLNNWNGQTIIDNEKNRILTNAFAAGNIDGNNTFNGVIMGQIAQITEGNIHDKKTGLFGYKSGAQVYGFRDDGTAFIGGSGAGRIYFDGNGGTISSAKYNGNTNYVNGTKIDLQSGSLIMEGSSGQYFKFNENNSGGLEIKINGANIILADEDNKKLTGYISATAESITSEFRKIATYSGIAEYHAYSTTDWTEWIVRDINTPTEAKELEDYWDYFKNGATLALNFIPGIYNEQYSAHRVYLCYHRQDTNSKVYREVLYNNKSIGGNNNNAFIFQPNALIYLIYRDGAWHITDGGANSKIIQTASNISASVSANYLTKTGGLNSTFGWDLDANGFYLKSTINGSKKTVFQCDSNGVMIDGTIYATGGTIANWHILDNYLYTGDILAGGTGVLIARPTIYASSGVGSDVIVCKQAGVDNFRVNSDGTVTASKMNITGGSLLYWNLEDNGMWSSEKNGNGTYSLMHLMSQNSTIRKYSVGSSTIRQDWRILLGELSTSSPSDTQVNVYNFGITSNGSLFTPSWSISSSGIYGKKDDYEITLTPQGFEYTYGTEQTRVVLWSQLVKLV